MSIFEALESTKNEVTSWVGHHWVLAVGTFVTLLIGQIARRALGFEKLPAYNTATKGFTPLQHELINRIFSDDQPTKILYYTKGMPEGRGVTFMSSPLGFGIAAEVINPNNRQQKIIFTAETPDAILKMLGQPESTFDNACGQRRIYPLESNDGRQNLRSSLRATLGMFFEKKMKLDIGAANLVRTEPLEGVRLQSPLSRIDVNPREDGSYLLTRYIGTYGSRTLTETPDHPIIKPKILPAGTTPEEAETIAQIRFLETHHKNKEELAGLRRRELSRMFVELFKFMVQNARQKVRANIQDMKNTEPGPFLINASNHGFRLSHISTFFNMIINEGLIDPIVYAFHIKPPLPQNIHPFRKDISVLNDFLEPVYFVTPDTKSFENWQLQDLREQYPDEPVFAYSEAIQYFVNFASKPVACVTTITADAIWCRRPCGIIATYTKHTGNPIVTFTYNPAYSTWRPEHITEWSKNKQPLLPTLAKHDGPKEILSLFGPKAKNIITLVNQTLYVMTPKQNAAFAATTKDVPEKYLQKISHEPVHDIEPPAFVLQPSMKVA